MRVARKGVTVSPPSLETPHRTRRNAFPRIHRIRRSVEFRRVFSDSQRRSCAAFVVQRRRNELGVPRLGLAISKRCANRAVDRQRIKRIVRESFRQHRWALPAYDYVVSCRNAAVNMTTTDLFDHLCRYWNSDTWRRSTKS